MAVLVTDRNVEERLKAEREFSGADRYDEVWDGVYVMPPMPNDEHQQLVMRMGSILQELVGWPGLGEVRAGVNVSDREDGWEHNYRVPDLAVFLHGGAAKNCGTHWCGGPDFLVEIVSRDDQSRDKLPFYQALGTRELLLIDRDPWALELHQLRKKQFMKAGPITPQRPETLISDVLPLAFCLMPGSARPMIEITHQKDQRRWLV
jgi:Uma2 family endonuclease